MAVLDIFIGVPQSKYAAMAIGVALVAVAVAMLTGKDAVPLGQKFVAILLMFLIALPSLLLSLFQLTCLVTGSGKGTGNKTWWCGTYAWIGTIFAFLYALVVLTVVVMSIASGTQALTADMVLGGAEGFADAKAASEAARKMADKAAKEYFADEPTADAIVPETETEVAAGAAMRKAAEAEEKAKASEAVAADAAGAGMPGAEAGAMPAEIVVPEAFFGGAAKAAPAAAKAGGAPAPSAPETFTSCGAPLAF